MAESNLNHFEKFDTVRDLPNIGTRWKRWLAYFEIYADSRGLILTDSDANKQRRRALLLHSAGQAVQDIFVTLANTGTVKDYILAVDALNAHFIPKVNASQARYEFRNTIPAPGESVLQFVVRLRAIAVECKYTDMDLEITDQVQFKFREEYFQRRLGEETGELKLPRILEIAQECERVQQRLKTLSLMKSTEFNSTTVNKVSATSNEGARGKHSGKPKHWKKQPTSKKSDMCYRCGYSGHYGRDSACPARGKTCRTCGGKDHFSTVCKTKSKLHHLEAESDSYAFSVNTDQQMITVLVGGISLDVLADTGSSRNVVDSKTWNSLKEANINCTSKADKSHRLYPYGATKPICSIGTFTTNIVSGKNKIVSESVVIEGYGVPLLSCQTSIDLELVKVKSDVAVVSDRDVWQQQYPDVYKGVGKLRDVQVTIHTDPEVRPIAQPLRRTPYQLRQKVDRKIQELLKMDIIEPVEGPTPWVNPVVIVPKGDDIRLCIDMRRANEAIVRERHPIPTTDDVLHNMNGSKMFSKLDLKMGYHQLELHPDSRSITTFVTHAGLYRYKRLSFGVKSAAEQYQYAIQTAIAGIEGVENISDDIIVHASDEKTHDERLHRTMKRLQDCNLTLNANKCQYRMNRLTFMGIVLSEKGIGPTEERVKAVVQAREPETQSEVRSFLGLANFSARFLPNFASVAEPLRRLTKKGFVFKFGPEQKAAFARLKQLMSSADTLAYFDMNAPTQVIADAGPVGLGGVLIQKHADGPVIVSYASRSLTDVERRYSQTEKEALGLVWACERFHPYIYGVKFELVTDHKPLDTIYGARSRPSARIERWVLRLQPYDYTPVYKPGSQNIADSLSRLLPHGGNHTARSEMEDYIRFVAVVSTPHALSTQEIERVSVDDSELSALRRCVSDGDIKSCDKQYTPVMEELCLIGSLILRGTRIVIPEKLRPRMLALAHLGHLGIVNTKQNLRTKVWWPGMERDAERHCRACHGCQIVAKGDPPEPIRTTPLPPGPWQDLAVDLLGPLPSGHSILVVVDYYSRFYEVAILNSSTTTDKVVCKLEEIFSRHGLPVTLKSDNGPQFISSGFADFCATHGINHVTVTARWAQANGEVERQNSSIMKRIRISQAEGKDWKRDLNSYLLVSRSLPQATTGISPAELLYGRKIRTKLPSIVDRPYYEHQEIRDRDQVNKTKSKLYADSKRHANYSDVSLGDQVLLKQDKRDKLTSEFHHDPHTVVQKSGNSVVVEAPSGALYSRNTTHVKKFHTPDKMHEFNTRNAELSIEQIQDKTGPVDKPGEPERVRTPDVSTPLEQVRPPDVSTPRPQRIRAVPKKLNDYVLSLEAK